MTCTVARLTTISCEGDLQPGCATCFLIGTRAECKLVRYTQWVRGSRQLPCWCVLLSVPLHTDPGCGHPPSSQNRQGRASGPWHRLSHRRDCRGGQQCVHPTQCHSGRCGLDHEAWHIFAAATVLTDALQLCFHTTE